MSAEDLTDIIQETTKCTDIKVGLQVTENRLWLPPLSYCLVPAYGESDGFKQGERDHASLLSASDACQYLTFQQRVSP